MTKEEEIEQLKQELRLLQRENRLLRSRLKNYRVEGETVSVPEQFKPIFDQAQKTVGSYFTGIGVDPTEGTIDVNGQRYVLVRASALSFDFLNRIQELYSDRGEQEANLIGKNFLFDIAHVIGVEDAKNFHKVMKLNDPIERLSAGPVHFAYCGWAFVDILPESNPVPNENYYLKYQHPYSFEADSWMHAGKLASSPVCVMNSGYASGWCEESFSLPLTAVEITCRACGDEHCTFIMAPPHKIHEYLEKEIQDSTKSSVFDVPMFFERKKAEEKIRASLQEKEMLLKEIHHRVKNNLQIISSLLKLQANYSNATNIGQVIHDSQTRIKTMAIVHEKLYQSNLEPVNLGDYIQSIAELTYESYIREDQHISINTLYDENPINIKIDSAISVGLLINEMLTNAIKYAFNGRESGRIEIEIRQDEEKELSIRVSDNGIGMPADFKFEEAESFGMELIQLLVTQLDADLEMQINKGTTYIIRFKIPG